MRQKDSRLPLCKYLEVRHCLYGIFIDVYIWSLRDSNDTIPSAKVKVKVKYLQAFEKEFKAQMPNFGPVLTYA